MSNNLRTRNGMPFNFVNGLKVRGMDIESLIPGIEGIPEAGSKYQFAGNGSNKAFTLPVSPYNKDAVDVYVKQLYVHPDDYTLVGDTITLTEAPPALMAGETYNVVIKVNLTTLNGYVNASRVSFEGENLDDILEKGKPLANYSNLRAYAGAATQVRITDPGIAGFFYYDATDTTSADNGGTIIVSANGKRWKRAYDGLVYVTWFGADQTGEIDCTNSVNNAMAYVQSKITGGTLYFPRGIYGITGVTFTWQTGGNNVTVNIKGEGIKSTLIKKLGSSTGPVFDFNVSALGNGVYSTFEGFRIKGNSICTGINLNRFARYQFRDVSVTDCLVGIADYGSLIADYYNLILENNSTGFRCAAVNGIYPNLMSFYGGSFLRNTVAGADISDAQNIFFNSVDVEFNGTAGDVTTGGIIIRSTCGSSNQNSNIGFNGSWFESNYGNGVLIEDALYLSLSFSDVSFHLNENYRALTCGSVRSLLLDNCNNNAFNHAYNIGAAQSVLIRGGSCWTINSSAIHLIMEGLILAGTRVNYRVTGTASGLGTYNQTQGRHNSGTGNVSAPTSGSPITLFAVSGSGPRTYNVFACLGGAGPSYMSNARIGWDGTNLTRMGGENATNLTITVSGTNVQATQNSGIAQTIFYVCDVIG